MDMNNSTIETGLILVHVHHMHFNVAATRVGIYRYVLDWYCM